MARIPEENGPRYAIYFVPPPASRLYRYGSSVLGYDAYTGDNISFPDQFGAGAVNWNELTAASRRYGFHATLKAPFFLARGCTEQQLVNGLRNLAGLGHHDHTFVPALCELEDFIALVPREPEARRRKEIFAALNRGLHHMKVEPSIAIDRLALMKQETLQAPFRVLDEAALKTGAPARG